MYPEYFDKYSHMAGANSEVAQKFRDYLASNPYISSEDMMTWYRDNVVPAKDFGLLEYFSALGNEYYSQARNNIYNDVSSGLMSGNDAIGLYGNMGMSLNPEESNYLSNLDSKENTSIQNAENRDLRDTSIISAADQYASLGLNPATVMYSGGANAGSVGTAQTNQNNPGISNNTLRMMAKQAEYNRKAQMAQTAIKVAGGLASAGVYGGALYAAKTSAARIASSMANSGVGALKGLSSIPSEGSAPLKGKAKAEWDSLMNQL